MSGNFAFAPFYDTGNVFARIKDIGLSRFSNTIGFGVRYKTPFGPLRVDLGFNLSPPVGLSCEADFLHDRQPILMNVQSSRKQRETKWSCRAVIRTGQEGTAALAIAVNDSGGGCRALACLVNSAHRAEVIDRLVAVVNRQIITLGDVEKELRTAGTGPADGRSRRSKFERSNRR